MTSDSASRTVGKRIREIVGGLTWRHVAIIAAVILGLAILGSFVMSISDEALGLLEDPPSDQVAYLIVFLFVLGDAVIALLPGETTLNVASVAASNGELSLGLVIVAGGAGAVIGDNMLYWIARSVPALRKRAKEAQEDPRLEKALRLVGAHASLLVVISRYLPYVRWAVIAGMGALPMPYGKFLLWSTIGGITWAAYTCVMAYLIGTALDEFPIASIVISCISSTVLLGVIYFVETRRRPHLMSDTESPPPPGTGQS